MREIGYYWVFGNRCFPENKNWSIYYWGGHCFWNDGDDFSEDTFEEIDERKIVRLALPLTPPSPQPQITNPH